MPNVLNESQKVMNLIIKPFIRQNPADDKFCYFFIFFQSSFVIKLSGKNSLLIFNFFFRNRKKIIS